MPALSSCGSRSESDASLEVRGCAADVVVERSEIAGVDSAGSVEEVARSSDGGAAEGSEEVDVVAVGVGLGFFFFFFLSMPALPLIFSVPPVTEV